MPALLAFGLGMGFVFGPLFNVILAGVEEHEVGSASGTLNAIQQLGNSIGVAVLATIFFSLLDHGHTSPTAMTPHGADLGRPCSSSPSRCPSCSPRTRGWRSSSPRPGAGTCTSRVPASGAAKASSRRPSARTAAALRFDSASKGSTSSVAAPSSRTIFQWPRDEAVDEQGRAARATRARRRRVLLDDSRTVGVGHEDVVVLGQEARGRGRRRVGQRGAGQVEQLGAALVAEAAQARAQALDHRAQAGQARPRWMSATVAGPKAAR